MHDLFDLLFNLLLYEHSVLFELLVALLWLIFLLGLVLHTRPVDHLYELRLLLVHDSLYCGSGPLTRLLTLEVVFAKFNARCLLLLEEVEGVLEITTR